MPAIYVNPHQRRIDYIKRAAALMLERGEEGYTVEEVEDDLKTMNAAEVMSEWKSWTETIAELGLAV